MEILDILSSVGHLSWVGFLIRTLVVGLMLVIFGKLIPLRAAGGLSAFDFTFFWMMGGLIAAPLFDAKISFADTLIAAVSVLSAHKIIAILAVKSRWFDSFVKGKPAYLIDNGHINERLMKSNLINNEILFSELRKNEAFHLTHVQSAFFENNGHLSVLKYPEYHTVVKNDLKLPVKETVTPQLIISDGKVDVGTLTHTDLNSVQLLKELQKQGLGTFKDVFIGYWEGVKHLFIQKKRNR